MNSTFYQSNHWPMKDSADPRDGWDVDAVSKTFTGPATNDAYGKLYYLVKDTLSGFYRRLHGTGLNFELFNLNAQDLSQHVADGTCARVEVCVCFLHNRRLC